MSQGDSPDSPINAGDALSDAPAPDELGPLVGRSVGGYAVTSYIGEGPTGVVYRAEDLLGKGMAMKLVHSELTDRRAAEHLVDDLITLSKIDSPHFVRLLDHGYTDEANARQFFFNCELPVGCDLESALTGSGHLQPLRAVEIVLQLCDALESAHGMSIVHGSIKPRNVFMVPGHGGPVVKLLDFGARWLAEASPIVVGDPFYLAPEQILDQTSDLRTDVYAVGVLMHELFTGRLPFDETSHLIPISIGPPLSLPEGIDDELGRIILCALARKREDRFQSISDLRAALERWATSNPTLLLEVVAIHAHEQRRQVGALAAHFDLSTERTNPTSKIDAPDSPGSMDSIDPTTAQVPKLDIVQLANASREEPSGPHPRVEATGPENGSGGGNGEKPAAAPAEEESVEASLEAFINQANANFPEAPEPVVAEPAATAAPMPESAERTRKRTATPPPPEPAERTRKRTATPPPPITGSTPKISAPAATATATNKPYDDGWTVDSGEVQMLDDGSKSGVHQSAKSGSDSAQEPFKEYERRKRSRSENSAPQRAQIPMALVFFGVLAALLIGAGLTFLLFRMAFVPNQSSVVQLPAPVVQPAPAAPVVTPINPAAPVVQPGGQLAAPAAPIATAPATPSAAPGAVAPAPTAAVPAPAAAEPAAPVPTAPAAQATKAEKHEGHSKSSSSHSSSEKKSESSSPKKSETPAKKEPGKKKSSDWVDPFAN